MYQNVLLAVDLNSESSWTKALPTAVACCQAFGARLHVVTVVPDLGVSAVAQYFPEGYETKMLQEAEIALGKLAEQRIPKALSGRRVVRQGTIYDEVLHAAEEVGADLIVLASHRPELRDYLIGPNAARVMRHANVSVLVVRE